MKHFKNLSILATGLVIANTGFGGPNIGPYKNDVLPLIKKIRALARTKLKASYDYNDERNSALELIEKQYPNGNKLNEIYKNSRYEQGISKRHVENYHIINKRDAEDLRQYDGKVLAGDILNRYAPFARTEKVVRSCGIGDWCKFMENIDFDAKDIRVFEVKGHDKKNCSSIKISVPYKGEIIVLDNENTLHFIKDDTKKFAVFVIDLYESDPITHAPNKFWVVSTIYPWVWIDTSTNEVSQASSDTVPSQTKPSTKTEVDRPEYENPFFSLLDDEDDSEDYPDSEQTSPDTLKEEEKSELPPLKTPALMESEPTPSQETKPAKAKPQNCQDKPSIKEEKEKKELKTANQGIRKVLLEDGPLFAEIELSKMLDKMLGRDQKTQKQKLDFLVQLNEDENDIVEDEVINRFCKFLFTKTGTTTTQKKTGKKGSKAEASDGHKNIIRYFASIISPGQLAYILLSAIVNGGNLDIVKYLIEQCHCDVNIQDEDGGTALHYACVTGHLNIVKYLVEECHCDVDIQSEKGRTALIFACENGHLNIVKYLVEECHCNVDIQDKNGKTALHYACMDDYLDIDIVKYLVEKCKATITDVIIQTAGNEEIKNYLREQQKEQKRNQNQ